MRILRSVVILFDRLVEDFHSALIRVFRNAVDVFQVLPHDDRFEAQNEFQLLFTPDALQGLDAARRLLKKVLPAADQTMGFANAVEGDGDARQPGESEFLNARLVVPISVSEHLRGKTDGRSVSYHIERIWPQ